MSDQPIERIETGMWAKVQSEQPGQETFDEVFHFVPSNQVDLLENKISIDSPLGQTLSGRPGQRHGRWQARLPP